MPAAAEEHGDGGPAGLHGQAAKQTKYYLLNGQRFATRSDCTGPESVTYFYKDHLGSTVATSASESARYYPYGAQRPVGSGVSTAYKFTGQRLDPTAGLYFYNARFYEFRLGREPVPVPYLLHRMLCNTKWSIVTKHSTRKVRRGRPRSALSVVP